MDEEKRKKLFGQIAVKLGYITIDDVKDALLKQEADEITGQKKHLGTYFFEDELLTKEQISKILQLQKKYIEKFDQQAAEANSETAKDSEPSQSVAKKIKIQEENVEIKTIGRQPMAVLPAVDASQTVNINKAIKRSAVTPTEENKGVKQSSTDSNQNIKNNTPSPDAKEIVAASMTLIKKWSQNATQESQKLFQSVKTFYNSKDSNENEINDANTVAETAEVLTSNENEYTSAAPNDDQRSSSTLICQECGLQLLVSDKSCPNCACPIETGFGNIQDKCNIELSPIENNHKNAYYPIVRKKFIIVVGGLLGTLILCIFLFAYSSDGLLASGERYYYMAKLGKTSDLMHPTPLTQDEIKECYRNAVINLVRAARLGNDKAMYLLRKMHQDGDEVTSKILKETEMIYNRTVSR